MERATELRNIVRVTKPEPLKDENFKKFFVETDEARGINAASMLSDFFSINRDEPQKVLFLGHRGSGKSTELFRFGEYLKDEFRIINFSIKDEADVADLEYSDLIFIILRKLYQQAKNDEIAINEHVLSNLDHYWHDKTLIESLRIEKAVAEADITVKGGFWGFISAHVKGIFSIGSETKKVVRDFIRPRLSQLLINANNVIDDITTQYGKRGKVPLLVIEDLDKLDLAIAEDLFLKRKNILTAFNIHVVYTFPIFLHYSEKFNEIESAFDHYELLSMIKVKEVTGERCRRGHEIIRNIVRKRADLNLFEPEALDYAIEKSGGSLRHLFEVLQNAVLDIRVRNREAQKIDRQAVENAYKKLRSYFERTITADHLLILKSVHESADKKPTADGTLKELLNCMAVIEYNGDRWCDLHPAVADILREKGDIE